MRVYADLGWRSPWGWFKSNSGKRFEQFNFQPYVQNQIEQNLLKVTGAESNVDANRISKLTW